MFQAVDVDDQDSDVTRKVRRESKEFEVERVDGEFATIARVKVRVQDYKRRNVER